MSARSCRTICQATMNGGLLHFAPDGSDRALIANALRCAQHQYLEDAKQCRRNGQDRVAQQFDRQASDAARLAEDFE